MNITVISPAAKQSRSGNRVTAVRWARILTELGHHVRVEEGQKSHGADLLVAIHAYRSAQAIDNWISSSPDRPLVVLLAGTDIYRFQHSHADITLASMFAAQRLVGLHDDVGDDIPAQFRAKLRIIHQSAAPLPRPRHAARRHFDICVVGHLRDEKDPFRAARAAAQLPASSKVRIVHLGKAHSEQYAKDARDEMSVNARYQWRGEVAGAQVRRVFARCQAMVMSSVMEGGANVVSEAIVAGLPVLASDISGNRGLLGAGHPAYYRLEDSADLARLMVRAETELGFLQSVRAHAETRRHLFTPQRERAAWAALLDELR
ncbi:MAG: putative glycosyltransferase (TIGR04348 family) [Gammaproteobacteria bacterium]|jgi:putative glycosyltransferase (TIGR04348 family)